MPSLLEAAQRVAKEFEYSDDEVIKGAKHFITQMRMEPPRYAVPRKL